jgi:hypothetical protein
MFNFLRRLTKPKLRPLTTKDTEYSNVPSTQPTIDDALMLLNTISFYEAPSDNGLSPSEYSGGDQDTSEGLDVDVCDTTSLCD